MYINKKMVRMGAWGPWLGLSLAGWGGLLALAALAGEDLFPPDLARGGLLSGVCCCLGGIWLLLGHKLGRRGHWLALGTAVVLGLLAGWGVLISLVAHVSPSLVPDWPVALNFGRDPRECPIAPSVFLAGAAVMLMVERGKGGGPRIFLQMVLYLALALTFVFAVAHVFNRLIGINLFDFGLPRFAQGWPRVVGGLLFLLGMVLSSWELRWFHGIYYRRPDRQVFAMGTVLLLMVGVLAGFLGASVLAHHTTAFFKQTLWESLRANRQTLTSSITQANVAAMQIALSLDQRLGERGEGRPPLVKPRLQDELLRQLALHRASGVQFLRLVDAGGRSVVQVGNLDHWDGERLPLANALAAWLVRDKEAYRLEIQRPLAGGGGLDLRLEVGLVLEEVSIYLDHAKGLGGYGQVLLCASAPGGTACLPRGADGHFGAAGSEPSPVTLALAERQGVGLFGTQAGGQTVAAYGYLPELRVAMVQAVDTGEIFAPLRKKVKLILLAVTLIVFAGATVLYRRVSPLVRTLTDTTQHLRDIQIYAGIGSWSWQRESGLIYLSEELSRLFGLPGKRYELTTRHGLALVHPEDREKFRAAFLATSRSGASFDLDFRVLDGQGGERIFNGQGHPVRDGAKQVSGIIGFVQDISERKQAEKVLRQSFREIEDLYNNAPCGYHSVDENGVIVAINDNALACLGLRREDVIGRRRMVDLVSPDTLPRYVEAFQRLRAKGEISGLEIELCRPDGGRVPVIANSTAIYGENGKFLRSRTSFFDITDRVEAERKLFAMSRLYALLSKANQAIIRSSSVPALYEEVCRIAVEEGRFVMAWIGLLDGDELIPYCHRGQESGYLEHLKAYIAGNGWRNGPRWQVRQDAGRFICQDLTRDPRVAPMRQEALARGYRAVAVFPFLVDGEVTGLFSLYAGEVGAFSPEVVELLEDLAEDISLALTARRERERRHQAEESLRLLNQELEWRVEARTRQYELANRELEAFSYSVSHDLRAPLRRIEGFSQIVLQRFGELLGETGRGYMERVCRATERMGALIEDMLQLARVSQVEESRSEVQLSEMARAILADLARQDGERGVEVRIMEGLRVYGDHGLLRIALENLLGNAWKFTVYRRDAMIEFGMRPDPTHGQVFYVRDNGAGFDGSHAQRLFKPFQRLHTEQEFDGSGIGLATVHKVINRHAGQIWAEGDVGQGACFYFTLPQRRVPREGTAHAAPTGAGELHRPAGQINHRGSRRGSTHQTAPVTGQELES